MSIAGAKVASISYPSTDIEKLKGQSPSSLDGEKARLKQATKAFESFFMYQILKTMRQTIPESKLAEGSPFSSGMSKDIFTEMFDMELADKMVNGDRRSISAILYDSLVKLLEAKHKDDNQAPAIKPLEKPEPTAIPIERETLEEIPETRESIEIRPEPIQNLPVATRPVSVRSDPILSQFGQYIDKAAELTALDPALIISVIKVESNGDPRAVSPAGAKGLMQLVDSTATDYGVSEVFDPEQNIQAGSRFLKAQLDRFGSLRLALAAYNAGPENVKRYGGVPPFTETQAYVDKVIDTLNTVARTGWNATPKVLK